MKIRIQVIVLVSAQICVQCVLLVVTAKLVCLQQLCHKMVSENVIQIPIKTDRVE